MAVLSLSWALISITFFQMLHLPVCQGQFLEVSFISRLCDVCQTYDIDRDGSLCKCDVDCEIYGDCCGHASNYTKEACEKFNIDLEGLQFTCEGIYLDEDITLMMNEAFWMVSNCPSDWVDESPSINQTVSIRDGCTSESRDLPPVTDSVAGIVYKNQYCAVCNRVQDTIQWKSNIVCTPYIYGLLENKSISEIDIEELRSQCKTCSYSPPDNTSPPRACFPSTMPIDYCQIQNLTKNNYSYEELETSQWLNCIDLYDSHECDDDSSREFYVYFVNDIEIDCIEGSGIDYRHITAEDIATRDARKVPRQCVPIVATTLDTLPEETTTLYVNSTVDYVEVEYINGLEVPGIYSVNIQIGSVVYMYRYNHSGVTPGYASASGSSSGYGADSGSGSEPGRGRGSGSGSGDSKHYEAVLIIQSVVEIVPLVAITTESGDLTFYVNITDIVPASLIVKDPTSPVDTDTAIGIPFTITLGIFGDGGTIIETETEEVEITVECPPGQAPVGLVCRDTVCPRHFVSRKGRCIDPTLNGTDMPAFLNCSTELVPLNDTEFTQLSNNTVQLVDGEVKDILGYSEDGQPLVCPDNVTSVNTTIAYFSYPTGYIELTYIGCSLSIIGSSLVLITYGLFKVLRTLPSKILMNLAFANLVTNLLILIGGPVSQAFPIIQLCTAVAICLHFFFLAQFVWMCVMSYEVVRKLFQAKKLIMDSKRDKRHLLMLYTLIGWGLPFTITTLSVIVNFATRSLVLYGVASDGSRGLCWINHLESAIVVFLIPLILCLLFNLIMFLIVTLFSIAASRSQAKLKKGENISFFRVTLAVFTTTGLTWIFGFIAILAGTSWAWYLFIIFNSTQGFVIFVAFICKKKILMHYVGTCVNLKGKSTSKEYCDISVKYQTYVQI